MGFWKDGSDLLGSGHVTFLPVSLVGGLKVEGTWVSGLAVVLSGSTPLFSMSGSEGTGL